jgi:cysteate synthase
METCSFKELEAISVLARVPEDEERTLVVSSAGNTGRAFLQVASRHNSPVVVVVPEFALSCMWSTAPRSPTVQLVVISGNSDYYDAIQLANAISELDPFYGEGGARNVARRDGMGTTALEAAFTIGRTPDHYFQAVGSGTGGIAAWEMTLRLLADGSFGDTKTRLHLVQNAPFTLMTDSWAASARRLATLAEDRAREQIRELHAPVLSNRFPPYSIRGGVFDALMDTDGRMYSVTNREALEAGKLFLELEGCDLDPAAEVAVAGLLNAVNGGTIPRDDTVVLNITGGGTNNVEQTGKKRYLKADIIFDSEELKNTANTPQLLALVQERMSSAREGVRS